MLILLDTNNTQWAEAPAELGDGFEIGQLMTPLTMYSDRGVKYAIDNGAFSGFSADKFRSLLKRQKASRERCIFVAVPDVVGSARRTLEVFRHWYPLICTWPLAFVAQDGVEDVDIPWDLIAAVFIGGSTEFKLSVAAEQVVRAAQAIGKWVHVGRVNTPNRVARFGKLGIDSIDGTGISRYGWMRRALGGDGEADQGRIFDDGAEGDGVRHADCGADASLAS